MEETPEDLEELSDRIKLEWEIKIEVPLEPESTFLTEVDPLRPDVESFLFKKELEEEVLLEYENSSCTGLDPLGPEFDSEMMKKEFKEECPDREEKPANQPLKSLNPNVSTGDETEGLATTYAYCEPDIGNLEIKRELKEEREWSHKELTPQTSVKLDSSVNNDVLASSTLLNSLGEGFTSIPKLMTHSQSRNAVGEDQSEAVHSVPSTSRSSITSEEAKMTAVLPMSHFGMKPFACDQCDYHTTSERSLKRHLRVHDGEKPFACNQCEYRGWAEAPLKAHMRTHSWVPSPKNHLRTHSEEENFACNRYDYRARGKVTLINHLRIHTGERPFACNHCDYRATEKASLIKHFRTHSREKPFACVRCDYRSSVKSNLYRHLRVHGEEINVCVYEGDKKYACDQCGYRTSVKSGLTRHVRTHSRKKYLFVIEQSGSIVMPS